MNDPKVLGKRLKFFRERANMSQFDLENAIGASPGMISRIENGRVNPTKESVQSIGHTLGLKHREISYLIGPLSELASDIEIEKARQEIHNYFREKGTLAYLLDDRWRLLDVSDDLIKLFGFNKKEVKEAIGKTIIEIITSEKFGIRNYLEKENYNKLIKYQLRFFYSDMYFMTDDINYTQTDKILMKNPFTSVYWQSVKSEAPVAFVKDDARIVNFRLKGINVKTHFFRESMLDNSRFDVVKYIPTNKLLKILSKF